MDLTTLTKKELTDKCKELSIKGYSNKNKNNHTKTSPLNSETSQPNI